MGARKAFNEVKPSYNEVITRFNEVITRLNRVITRLNRVITRLTRVKKLAVITRNLPSYETLDVLKINPGRMDWTGRTDPVREGRTDGTRGRTDSQGMQG